MKNMSVHNIPDNTYQALKVRAKSNGRSSEAEVRALIEEAVKSTELGGFGTRLRRIFEDIEGDELSETRDRSPAQPPIFE